MCIRDRITTFSGSAVWFKGATANKDMYWSHASGATVYKDNAQILMGDNSDLQLYHNGSNSIIDTNTGDLILRSDADDIKLLAEDDIVLRDNDDSTNFIHCINGGAVKLYYAGNEKFETRTDGVKITGEIYLDDNSDIKIGTSQDINIWHNGTSSGFDNKTGHLYIRGNYAGDVGGNIYIQALSGEESIVCIHDAAVELYHNGARRFHTKTEGVAVEGSVNLEGSQNTQPSHGGINRHTNGWVYFSGKSDGSGASLNNGDGTATVRAVSPGGSNGYITMESGDGSERLRITSGGHVNIGESSTQTSVKLHVDSGTTNNATVCTLKNDSTSAYATNDGGINTPLSLYSDGTNAAQSIGIQFYLQKSGETGCISEIGAVRESSGNSNLVFRTRDSSTGRNERMRIASTGNVSIGTQNVTEGKLQVNGDISAGLQHGSSGMYGMLAKRKFDGSNALGGYAIRYASGYESPWIVGYNAGSGYDNQITFGSMTTSDRSLATGVTKRMVIDMETGNVGIGIANPSNKLEISGGLVRCLGTASARFTANNGSAEGFVGWNSGTFHIGEAAATTQIAAAGANIISMVTNSNERLRIASNGSVGVNITNPQVYDPAARALVVGEVDGYGHTGMTIRSNGTDKQGAIYFADGTGSSSYRGRIEYQHDNDSLRFGTAGSGGKIIINTDGTALFDHATDEKIILTGSASPFIRFQEGTTNRAYALWNATTDALEFENTQTGARLRLKDEMDFSDDSGTNYGRVHHGRYFGHWGDDYTSVWVGTQNASDTVRDDEKNKWYRIGIHEVSWSGGANTIDIVRANVHQDAGVHGNWYGSLDARIIHRTSRCGHGASYVRWVHHFSSSPPSGGFIGKTSNYLACGESSRLYVWLRGQATYAIRINGRPAHLEISSGNSGHGGPGSSQVLATQLWDPITSIQSSTVMAMGNDTYQHSESLVYGGQSATGYGTKIEAVSGGVDITGNLSKDTGSFRIPHPLVGLSTTKNLVHSFIEGPQMDLIYRGKVDLVNGTASVNIDTKTGMTEGTFVALNRDVQCFTTNETGWTNIKGSVTGNIITIVAQDNSCTDTISWMVVGERQDDKAKESILTDNDGNLIVEPDQEPITETDFLDTPVENQTDEQVAIMQSMMN